MSAPAVDTGASSASLSASQRAVRIYGPRDARVDLAPIPEPGPGQVLVRLEGSGVCASNIPVWQGRPWFDYPMPAGAPGHEGWGHVAALGPQVQWLETGQRVCLVSGSAYSEWDVADAAGIVPIPDILSHLPIPGEPLGCAMNAFRRAGIRAGDEVAIVGVGFLGALLVRLATNAGARVTAISRRPFSLDVARQCGAENTLPFGDPVEVERQVRDLTSGRGCDVVIECVGLQEALDVSTKLTRERGRLVIAGFHQDGPRQVDMQLWNWRGLDVVNAHERDIGSYAAGMREALAEVASGLIPLELLVTHRFPLEELGSALQATESRPDGFLKAVVVT